MIFQRIKKLRELIKLNNLDGYIIPKNDQYFSEFAFPNRLKNISGFTGSAGFAIILKKNNYLFVDGRYITQAKIESSKNFKIVEIPKLWPKNILKNNNKISIGFDPKLFTTSTLLRYFENVCKLYPINNNLIDEIYKEKKAKSTNLFYSLSDKTTGETTNSKINRIIKKINKSKIDNIFISAPENVAWILNIRGKDNPYSPIPNCKMILTKNKKIYLFTQKSKIKKIIKINPYKNFSFSEIDDIPNIISKLKGNSFCVDRTSCSIFYQSLINSKFIIKCFNDPSYDMKAIKNSFEIENMKTAHIFDGAALTKFLYWIKNNKLKKITELDVEKKLESFRKNNKNFLYPSFNTIAGSGPNGAIIHYRANKDSNRKINKKDLLLCDSGGQYKFGTTDVTRTICFNKPPKKIKEIYTRVLKGHIAVFATNLNKINKGYLIDKRARYWLNKVNLDYGHGTGHGVGFFLNVHEGPQAISKYNNITLKKGMILSNEPGYYKENKFGIRIENLVFIDKEKKCIKFKNLTLAPLDRSLIDNKLLTKKEKNYISEYHTEIYLKVAKFLNNKEKKWMLSLI